MFWLRNWTLFSSSLLKLCPFWLPPTAPAFCRGGFDREKLGGLGLLSREGRSLVTGSTMLFPLLPLTSGLVSSDTDPLRLAAALRAPPPLNIDGPLTEDPTPLVCDSGADSLAGSVCASGSCGSVGGGNGGGGSCSVTATAVCCVPLLPLDRSEMAAGFSAKLWVSVSLMMEFPRATKPAAGTASGGEGRAGDAVVSPSSSIVSVFSSSSSRSLSPQVVDDVSDPATKRKLYEFLLINTDAYYYYDSTGGIFSMRFYL